MQGCVLVYGPPVKLRIIKPDTLWEAGTWNKRLKNWLREAGTLGVPRLLLPGV